MSLTYPTSLGCLVFALTCPAQNLAWTQIKPTTSPAARYTHAMAYDSTSQRTVLFGGATSSGSQADTWEWNGKDWSEVKAGSPPPVRLGHGMVYDAGRQRMVMFGGLGSSGYLADTWEWNGKNWVQSKPQTSPSARYTHAMVYDSARQRTVLFGGFGSGGPTHGQRRGEPKAGDRWQVHSLRQYRLSDDHCRRQFDRQCPPGHAQQDRPIGLSHYLFRAV